VGGLAVVALGHAHPAVAEAVARQARTLVHTSNLYGTTVGVEVARHLDRLLGGGGQVFFANSGAEANECAIKLARRWAGPGRYVVVSALGSFHGRTLATLHATGQPHRHEPFLPLPEGFRHVPWGNLEALDEALAAPDVAALLLEPIQGEGGVRMPPEGWLEGAAERCAGHGRLLVLDEVQAGLGRTGRWFGFQHHGIAPDVVTVAKSLGNGMPIGACWAREPVAAAFRPGDHATTFGGQPLAAAAARATLRILEAEGACERAAATGQRLAAELAALPGIAGVRGRGLFLAAELGPEAGPASAVAARAQEAGVLVNPVTPTALRLLPPLLITDDELDEAVGRLAGALGPAGPGPRP